MCRPQSWALLSRSQLSRRSTPPPLQTYRAWQLKSVNWRRSKLIERLGIAGVMLALAALSLAPRPSAYAQTPQVAAAATQAQTMITAAVSDAVRATLAGNTR